MAAIKYRDIRLSKQNKERLSQVNSIISEYQEQGYVLTLRQLYYQLVSRDVIANQLSEYAKLSKLLKEGRMAGIVDWEAIEDRLREPSVPSAWNSPKEIISSCIAQYRAKRMDGQDNYIEVWVEKDALSGVLKRVTEKYHVPIVVNRGYSSATAMHEAYKRFYTAIEDNNAKRCFILYLGDYDPSGIDMIRDVEDRIREFIIGGIEYGNQDYNFSVKAIALTKKQIELYKPPSNPAKVSDARAAKFIRERGSKSWEVDALKPEVLNQILEDSILSLIDLDMYESMVSSEIEDINKLKEIYSSF